MSKQITLPEELTQAQKELLEMVDHQNAADYAAALKEIHELGTYYTDKELVNLNASRLVHWLYDAILELAKENAL